MEIIKWCLEKWKQQWSILRKVIPNAILVIFEVSLGWWEPSDIISEMVGHLDLVFERGPPQKPKTKQKQQKPPKTKQTNKISKEMELSLDSHFNAS